MRYISQSSAYEHYDRLYDLHTLDIFPKDKANRLRTELDLITAKAIRGKYGDEITEKLKSLTVYERLSNHLFDDGDELSVKLRADLHQVRHFFNNVQHRGHYVTEGKYMNFFRSVVDCVSFFSSVPIPSHLLYACNPVSEFKMTRRLDVVIVLELYNSLNNVEDGVFVLKSLKRLLKKKNDLRLKDLHIHVVVYGKPIVCYKADDDCQDTSVNDGLKCGLGYLHNAISGWEHNKTGVDKPFFIWLTHTSDPQLSSENVDHIQKLIDERKVNFYPVRLCNSGDHRNRNLNEIWPGIVPILMNIRRSDNFFNDSLLGTIERMQNRKTDKKTDGMKWKIASQTIKGKGREVCQDYVVQAPIADFVCVVAADGAGSARYAREGAEAVTKKMRELLLEHRNDIFNYSDQEIKDKLLETLRAFLAEKAVSEGAEMNDYMSTLMFFVSDGEKYIAGNLGDGMIGCLDENGQGSVIAFPEKGKFVNVSYFVTQEDSASHLRLERGPYDVNKVYFLMTDGSTDCLYNFKDGSFGRILNVFSDWIRKYPPHYVSANLRTAMMQLFRQKTLDDCALALLVGSKE